MAVKFKEETNCDKIMKNELLGSSIQIWLNDMM